MNLLRKSIIGSLVIVLTYVLWIGYVYILQRDLFYYHFWLDVPLHIGGGLIVSLLVALVLYFRNKDTDDFLFYYYMIWWALAVGVIWEYYEFTFKLYESGGTSLMIDTLFDLSNDFIGAGLGVLIVYMVNLMTARRRGSV